MVVFRVVLDSVDICVVVPSVVTPVVDGTERVVPSVVVFGVVLDSVDMCVVVPSVMRFGVVLDSVNSWVVVPSVVAPVVDGT